jgi:hypothetical protein
MATPRHRSAPRCPQPPLGMKPALKHRYEVSFYYCYQSRTATKPRSTTATKSRTATKPRSTTAAKLVLSLRRAKPEPSPRVLRRVRLPLNHVLLHIRSRQRPQQSRVLQPQRYRLRKPVTRTAVKPVSRSTTRKVGGGAGCGSENWVGDSR